MSDASAEWPFLALRQAARDRLTAAVAADEGLRERKKRLMRQQISDTATALFLERGFDHVRVSEVAAACGVSEKTVFNYFPTKEALVLDREDELAAGIRRLLGPGSPGVSPVEAAVALLAADATDFTSYWEARGWKEMSGLRRFTDLIEQTPSLRTAYVEMTQRLAQVAALAMADRAGVNPDDPEPQIAADALLGLWRIYFRSTNRYSDKDRAPAEVGDLVMADVRRAARLIDTGLWSFGMAVQGSDGRHQLKMAADASNDARKQVLVAIKQAREAWRLLKSEAHEHSHDDHDGRYRSRGDKRAAHRDAHEARRGAQPRPRRRTSS